MSPGTQPDLRRGRGLLAHGFWNPWGVAASYEVRDGHLHYQQADPSRPERAYEPAERPEIVTDLARLAEGDEAAVLVFARQWGHLGYGELVQLASESRASGPPRPEPLDWIWAHARGVRVCLELLDYLGQRRTARLAEYLQSLVKPAERQQPAQTLSQQLRQVRRELRGDEPDAACWGEPPVVGYEWPWLVYGVGHLKGESTWHRSPAPPPRAIAEKIIEDIVSANIGGIGLALHHAPGADGSRGAPFVLTYTFTPLVLMAYWHLANLAARQGSFGRCAHCQKFFTRIDPRDIYCPPPRDAVGRKLARESLCGRKARARRDRTQARQRTTS